MERGRAAPTRRTPMGRTECTRRLERHRTSAKCAVRCVGNEGWKGSVWNLRLGLAMGKGKEKKGFAYSIAPSDASVLGRAVSSTSLNKSRMSTSVVPENLLSHPSGVAIISMENFCFLTFFWRGGKKHSTTMQGSVGQRVGQTNVTVEACGAR